MATINGTTGPDLLLGTAQADIIRGFDGDDVLDGLEGDDDLDGGAGNDVLVGGLGNDRLAGGDGNDTVDYSVTFGSVTVSLLTGIADDGKGGTDTLLGIENIIGSTIHDTLTGNNGDNIIRGGTGNDTIYGLGGSDFLLGEDGYDIIFGGDGNDTIVGGNLYDQLDGGDGFDTVDYSGDPGGVTIDLYHGGFDGWGEYDAIKNFENITGSAFADVLAGDWQNNILRGNAGNDRLIGREGDDVLVGGAGNDTLEGGANFDVAVHSGWRSAYALQRSGGDWTITDQRAGSPDGTDLLKEVELLQFTDGAIDIGLTSANADEAYRIYQAAFDRMPDAGGLRYWTGVLDAGASLRDVAGGFMGSAEFQAMYGANPTNSAFVNLLYNNVLDRNADAGGEAFWAGHLNSGALGRADVLAYFSESEENIARTAQFTENGFWVI
jgi:Ca2+-binding RTX toxin-like protein